jgi:hypothetical protein
MEGVTASLVSLGSGIVRRRRARLIVSLANGAVPRRARQGRQAQPNTKRPFSTLLRATESPWSTLKKRTHEWIEQPNTIQCWHPSGAPTLPGPTGFIAASGRNHIPGYRSHSSFVDGRDARLVIVRLPSGSDQHRASPPSLRKRWAETRTEQQGRMREGFVQIELTSTHSWGDASSSVGRQARHAHGARGFHRPKPAVERLARPTPSARNPRRGSTGRRRRDNVCKNS